MGLRLVYSRQPSGTCSEPRYSKSARRLKPRSLATKLRDLASARPHAAKIVERIVERLLADEP